MDFYENMSKKELYDKWVYFEQSNKTADASAKYYREELEKAHALIGRITHQMSERWDSVNITSYFPTDNLSRKRTVNNPSGEKS